MNQTVPSGPAVGTLSCAPATAADVKSVAVPDGVRRTTSGVGPPESVIQRFPSGPAVIPVGCAPASRPAEVSWITPAGVIQPTRPFGFGPFFCSVNHTLPSGPPAIDPSPLYSCELRPLLNRVCVPALVMRPIGLAAPGTENQTFPSGPAATATGP